MAHRNATLQKPDAELIAFTDNMEQQCTTHAILWHLDEGDVTELSQLAANARNAYAANSAIATKNRTTSETKKAAFAELKQFLSVFINFLEGNRHVPDEAIALMGLRPRKRAGSQPLPVPAEEPVLSIMRHHDELIVYASRAEHDRPTANVAPTRYHGFQLRWKFKGDVEWKTILSTRLHHTLHFEHDDRGKSVILSAAWVNPRLQPGPYSDDLTEVIS